MAYIQGLLTGNNGGAGNSQIGQLAFGTSGAERLRINASGNVGIGEASPSELLHIKSTTADTHLQVEAVGAGLDARLNLYGNSTGVSQIRFGDEASTTVGLLTYDHSADSMAFRTNGALAATIDSSGNVQMTGSVTADTVNLGTAPATLEHFVSSFSQISNSYSTIHTFTAPAAGHYLFTISASLGSPVYGKLELTDGSTTLLSANWGYNNPHYSLFRTGLITLDGSTNVVFRGARNDGGGTVTMRGVQAYAVRLG